MLFAMRGNGSIGSWYRNTIYSSYQCRNDDEKSSEEEVLKLSLGEESRTHGSLKTSHCSSRNIGSCEICGHRSQDTRQSTSSNLGGCGRRSSMTLHYSSSNRGGYVDRGGSRSRDTSHSFYSNLLTRVDAEGTGGYRSLSSYYYLHNQGEYGILFTLSGDNVGGYGRVG